VCPLEQPRRAGCVSPECIKFFVFVRRLPPLKLLPNQRAAIDLSRASVGSDVASRDNEGPSELQWSRELLREIGGG